MASEKKASPFAGIPFTPGEIYDVKKEELLKYAVDIYMDSDTVNKQLTLSERNKKATNGPEQTYPPNPERFETYPQVLAKEALKGMQYWEVDWSDTPDESVYIGVAYGSIERTGPASEFGNNSKSWVLGQSGDPTSERTLKAYHDGKVWEMPSTSGGCKRVGVFLDWDLGTLYFFCVLGSQNGPLFRFETKFTEPVFPCFWVGKSGNFAAMYTGS
ncbi:stonustoxin subunit alpha-like [Sparus aurata]|uniref:stonustoxin subunit alpha-like n=1 Tax=Sparus aurata TaxID=8175 RepID=UPI0011C1C436|nr:stonustoxin subunit alpha-like [Sparus aurata]XP_030255025.1 stonustoxin subunit alpha-like [Sparus aurata]